MGYTILFLETPKYFAFASITFCILIPRITPGKIEFTLILYFPNSIAAVLVKLMFAALLAAYGDRKWCP